MTPTPPAVAAAPPAHVEHTNRLAREKSPYLLQHAHNPVDWYPWGEEAFAKARREKKPIFLSIGYSTCHWCHVMERESFENEEVAAVMNAHFVNIKVDREERPDVDRVYMTFVQATSGGGGWPLNVWLTPGLKPFVGGTYFPPEDRYGQPSFMKVLHRIADAWESDRAKISQSGDQIIAALAHSANTPAEKPGKVNAKVIEAAYQQIARGYDAREGGFGGAPKFPRPVTLNFLFHVYHRSAPNSEEGEAALGMGLFTLRKMAAGGIHDQLGGGFHRYSVDAVWHVPHFEKMLYDQAQLASSYVDAYQITGDLRYEGIARDTLDYVRRDMTDPGGGFYSAEDADSLTTAGSGEKAEGAFYVWTKNEIDEALGEYGELFDYQYGVEADGNAPEGSDPQGEFKGKNILYERQSFAETAKHFGRSEMDVDESMRYRRATLLEMRAKRPRPHLDDKIITAWNGLMISAFARAAQVLGDTAYLEAATRAADFVRSKLYDEEAHTLARSYRGGPSGIGGFAEDYAFYIQGLLDLYEASFDVQWLQLAEQLQATQDRLFWDDKNGGYFGSTGDDPSILLRLKDDNDNAEPAPSSIAALNLLRLAQIRDSKELRARGEKTIAAFGASLDRFPSAMPQLLVALDFSLTKPRQIIIAGQPGAPETRELIEEVYRHYLPDTIVLLADGGEGQKFLAGKLEEMKEMKPVGGKAAAYVCEDFTCKAPVTTREELRKLLSR
ncbi:MAG TPA: thioredoxin domain-containing protein [Chthoniobacterales bacterium]|nr:thioredoxin domain-containing protein [Chthoniobacterales bacterium]